MDVGIKPTHLTSIHRYTEITQIMPSQGLWIMSLEAITKQLIEDLQPMRFQSPVTHVYNPLTYAWKPHATYLKRFGQEPREIVLLGMNPGPWGMAQTGVPFGDVVMVRDWMGITGPVGKPDVEHPQRPIMGFDCDKREVSGSRLWGWAKKTYGTPERFFQRFYVINYCPLCFMEESGKNFTPDKIRIAERRPLLEICDRAFRQMVEFLQPRYVLGVGGFAQKQAQSAVGDMNIVIGGIPHPSPANPAANYGWAAQAEKAFAKYGIAFEETG